MQILIDIPDEKAAVVKQGLTNLWKLNTPENRPYHSIDSKGADVVLDNIVEIPRDPSDEEIRAFLMKHLRGLGRRIDENFTL